jgi:purine nucleosidase
MRVLFDHDGGVDDFVALALHAVSSEVDLAGVCVTPGDTYMESAVPATRALLDLAGRSHVEVGAGVIEGPNPFPPKFRVDGHKVRERTMLREASDPRTPLALEPGHEFEARVLKAEPEPLVVVATGPLTTLAAALDAEPSLPGRIGRLYWMGGAIDVPGNVRGAGHDGSAEWNVYCDPPAAARVLESDVDVFLCPLDATNRVPLSMELIDRLEGCAGSHVAAFAAQAYRATDQAAYHLWDVLTAAWPLRPDLLTTGRISCVVETSGPSEGRIHRSTGGRAVTAALGVDTAAFFDFVVERLCEGP